MAITFIFIFYFFQKVHIPEKLFWFWIKREFFIECVECIFLFEDVTKNTKKAKSQEKFTHNKKQADNMVSFWLQREDVCETVMGNLPSPKL